MNQWLEVEKRLVLIEKNISNLLNNGLISWNAFSQRLDACKKAAMFQIFIPEISRKIVGTVWNCSSEEFMSAHKFTAVKSVYCQVNDMITLTSFSLIQAFGILHWQTFYETKNRLNLTFFPFSLTRQYIYMSKKAKGSQFSKLECGVTASVIGYREGWGSVGHTTFVKQIKHTRILHFVYDLKA